MVKEKKVWFNSNGEVCSGLLYLPEKIEGKLPAILMANGFGAVKEMYLPEYAKKWASEGFVVLVFDYRYFGESAGQPRQRLWPTEQIADYLCAARYLSSLEEVDSKRLCVWGTSFSGGHVLTLLAFSDVFKCGVAQVPNLFTVDVAKAYFGSLKILFELANYARESSCLGNPLTIPIVSKEGVAALVTEEAYNFYSQAEKLFPTFKNYITLDSVERILMYNPGYYAHLVEKPIKFVVAENDITTPPSFVKKAFDSINSEKEMSVIKGAGHFDVYFEPTLSKAAQEALEWFKKFA